MFLSTLRDSLCPDDLEIPPRPTVEATELGTHRQVDGTESSMYRLSLVQHVQAGKPHFRSSIDVVHLEIFGCVQKLKSPEMSRWKQVAQVDLRKKKVHGCERRKDGSTLIVNSVKMAGFGSGFRYQIVVRGVDAHGKRSLFSKPVFIIPTKESS